MENEEMDLLNTMCAKVESVIVFAMKDLGMNFNEAASYAANKTTAGSKVWELINAKYGV